MYRYLILVLACQWLAFTQAAANTVGVEPTSVKVLFLMGAETAVHRARQIVDGFNEANKDSTDQHDFLVIQTDLTSEESDYRVDDLKNQVGSIQNIDYIVASWLPELNFATRHTRDIPIINLSPEVSDDPRVETLGNDLAERIFRTGQLALTLPKRSKVAVVVLSDFSDDPDTRELVSKELQSAGFETIKLIEQRDLDLIFDSIKGLSSADALFYLPFTQNAQGELYRPFEVVSMIAERTDAPVFSMWRNFIGNGAIGGYVFDPATAGGAVHALISDRINRSTEKDYAVSTTVVDDAAYRRFGGDPNQLYGKVTLINSPTETSWSIWKSIVLSLVAMIFVGLVVNSLNRRRLKRLSDINERLTNYQKTLAAMESVAKIGSWSLDTRTKEVTWSRWTRIIHEVDEDFSPDLESGINFYPEGFSRETITTAVQLAIETGEPWDLELPIRTDKNNDVWVRTQGQTEFDDQGECIRVFGVFQDITDKREYVEALRVANDKAQRNSKMKSEFLANMSHEIRTPMNAVLGLAQVLANPKQYAPDVVINAKKIMTAGKSLQHLLNDILDFSKIESGKLTLSLMPMRLAEIQENLALLMTHSARDKKIELVIQPLENTHLSVVGDQLRLEQVLTNLISNAIKFTHTGFVALEIKELPSERDNNLITLQFSVRDSGIGIDQNDLERILEPFTQVDGTITRRFGGSGLGLSICQRLLALMDSELEVSSAPNAGSTFSFTLQLEMASYVDRIRINDEPALEVMVVDDQPIARDAICTAASALGWHPIPIEGGASAVDVYRQRLNDEQAVDLVLMDWVMPDVDGLSAAKKIKASHQETDTQKRAPVVIMVTAFSEEEIRNHPDSSAVDLVMNKPVTVAGLSRALEAVRGSSQTSMQVATTLTGQKILSEKRLLIVDDNVFNRDVAKLIFEMEGAIVSVAEDGLQAVEWLENSIHRADAVIMDVQMPVMDGLEATKILRQRPRFKNLPIVGMSAGAYDSDVENALNAGMNAYIKKPIIIESALEVLKEQLSLESLTDFDQSGPVEMRVDPVEPNNDLLLDAETAIKFWGTHANLASYLDLFLRENADKIESYTAKEAEALPEEVHKLKGSAGSLYLNKLRHYLQHFEDKLTAGLVDHTTLDNLRSLWAETSAEASDFIAHYSENDASTKRTITANIGDGFPISSGELATLFTALDTYNPDRVMEVLDPLLAKHDSQELTTVSSLIYQFKFGEAREIVKSLQKRCST